MNEAPCPECRVASGGAGARGVAALRLGAFSVHPKLEAPPVPGWVVVAPVRHVEQWDALDAREQAELGPLVARVSAALRAETPTAKVYISVFAEVLAHFHVHVVARPPGLPEEMLGPRLLLAEGKATEAECADLFRRVRARLLGRTSPRSPLVPVLLSGLLWPGLGQLRNGDRLKGLCFALVSLLGFLGFLVRVARDATEALLEAREPMGLLDILALAQDIRARHAAELSLLTLLLFLVWVASVLDAWWGARRPVA